VELVEAVHLVGRPAFLRRVAHPDGVDAERFQPVDDRLSDCAEPSHGNGRAVQFRRLVGAPLAAGLPAERRVKPAGMCDHRPDDVLGDVRTVDSRRVRHRDPALRERVAWEVVRPREHAREEFQTLRHLKQLLVDVQSDRNARGPNQLALVGRRPRPRHLNVREPFADRRRQIARAEPVDRLSQHDDIWVAHVE